MILFKYLVCKLLLTYSTEMGTLHEQDASEIIARVFSINFSETFRSTGWRQDV